jgi:hypothetical protein
MIDPDEAKLSKLAKSVLAMPHKNREESKIGKTRRQSDDSRIAASAQRRIRLYGPPSEQMVIYDVGRRVDGSMSLLPPYLLNPDGTTSASPIAASK